MASVDDEQLTEDDEQSFDDTPTEPDANGFVLKVTLKRGRNLVVRDITGKSDPYVIFSVRGGPEENRQTQKSRIKKQTLNPVWNNETFAFSIDDADKQQLYLEVFDYDRFSPDEFMGIAYISLKELAESDGQEQEKIVKLEGVKRGELLLFLSKSEPERARPQIDWPFRNIVFEGGGVKALAFAGTIRVLEDEGALARITRISGSSAGSICAAMLAVGFSSHEIFRAVSSMNMKRMCDHILNLKKVLTEYGICAGDEIYKWMGKLLQEKTGNMEITFQDVYDRYGKLLVIPGVNINRAHTVYFSKNNFPNMPIRLAVRISTAIPFFYTCIKASTFLHFGDSSIASPDDLFVDGGVLDCFPLWIFDAETDEGIADRRACHNRTLNPETIGVKLTASQSILQDRTESQEVFTTSDIMGSSVISDGDSNSSSQRVRTIVDFGFAVFNSLFEQIEKMNNKPDYWRQTILINCLGVGTVDFNLPKQRKKQLADEGTKATRRFLERWKLLRMSEENPDTDQSFEESPLVCGEPEL